MIVPKAKFQFAASTDGKTSQNGFVVIELKGMDLDGVNKLVLDVDEINAAIAQGDKQEQAKKTAWELLSGE